MRLILIALLTLPLIACGSAEEATSTAGGGGDGFPVTVEHKFGATTVEREPERS